MTEIGEDRAGTLTSGDRARGAALWVYGPGGPAVPTLRHADPPGRAGTASALSLGGLIKHCARTERGWVVAGIAGQPLPGLWPPDDWPADFRLEPDETLAGVLGYYAETAELTEQIVAAAADLGVASAGGRAGFGALGTATPDQGNCPARRSCGHHPGKP
jgi:hypothetical protein